MAKKWVINNGQLLIGNVDFHRDLVIKSGYDLKKTIGGGYWDIYNHRLYFFGSSDEFGAVTKDVFEDSLKSSRLSSSYMKVEKIFSNKMMLSQVLIELNH